MLYSYGYCYFPQRRRAAETCVVTRSAKVGRGTAARDGQKCEKGTQRRKGRRGRRACVMGVVMGLGRECAHYRLLLLLLLQNLTKQ